MGGLITLTVGTVIAPSFVLPGVLTGKTAPGTQQAAAAGTGQGAGLPAGSPVPRFAGRDLLTGKVSDHVRVRLRPQDAAVLLRRRACQACLEQIRGLQQLGGELTQRGIQLIAVTTGPPGDLGQAARQYEITTPLISDAGGRISAAFNTIGQGMMATTPGHAFALIYHGKVLWYRDYWLAPYRTMYVQPQKLLADIPATPR